MTGQVAVSFSATSSIRSTSVSVLKKASATRTPASTGSGALQAHLHPFCGEDLLGLGGRLADIETDDRRAVVVGGVDLNLPRGEATPEALHQRLRPGFDLVEPDALQVLEGGGQLVEVTERQRRVLELFGALLCSAGCDRQPTFGG